MLYSNHLMCYCKSLIYLESVLNSLAEKVMWHLGDNLHVIESASPHNISHRGLLVGRDASLEVRFYLWSRWNSGSSFGLTNLGKAISVCWGTFICIDIPTHTYVHTYIHMSLKHYRHSGLTAVEQANSRGWQNIMKTLALKEDKCILIYEYG